MLPSVSKGLISEPGKIKMQLNEEGLVKEDPGGGDWSPPHLKQMVLLGFELHIFGTEGCVKYHETSHLLV